MKKIFLHILLWIVSLSILNTSIDVADELTPHAPGTVSLNADEYIEIESIAELVMNEATDQSFPDQKGNDQQGMIKKTASFDFSMPEKKQKGIPGIIPDHKTSSMQAYYTPGLSSGYRTILTPPPNQAI